MTKFIGANNDGVIKFISDGYIASSSHSILALPKELESVEESKLLYKYEVRQNKVLPKLGYRNAKSLKVAFVSNFKMVCGISEYFEKLCPEIIKHLGDYKLFVEYNDQPVSQWNKLGDQIIDDSKIVSCWRRGQSAIELINAIHSYNPDIVLIQMEWGLFYDTKVWLSLLTQLSKYRVIATMHSIYHHRDKMIAEAALKEMVVHLPEAVKVIKEEKQLLSKVYVIPHGCEPCRDGSKLYNILRSPYTFIQQGFAFSYKNFEDSLYATALLKQKFPDVFFTALLSEGKFSKLEHQQYFEKLLALTKQLNIIDNVALIRGFQSDNVLDAFLRVHQVGVFPYKSVVNHKVFGASGASRTSMTKGLPLITSSIPHFSDLPTIKADTPEAIAQELEKLFLHPKLMQEQVARQNKYLIENSWEKVAQKYVDIFENFL